LEYLVLVDRLEEESTRLVGVLKKYCTKKQRIGFFSTKSARLLLLSIIIITQNTTRNKHCRGLKVHTTNAVGNLTSSNKKLVCRHIVGTAPTRHYYLFLFGTKSDSLSLTNNNVDGRIERRGTVCRQHCSGGADIT